MQGTDTMGATGMAKVAMIYCRVSAEIQVQHGTSFKAQEFACLRKAQEMGARVLRVVRDEGVSGALYFTREGIQSVLDDIESGAANILLVAKLDRAGRDVPALRDIRRRVNQAGGELIFADGLNFANNATGNLMFNQMSAYAEYEKEVIAERTGGGRERNAKKGKQPCRNRPPMGYYIVMRDDVVRGTFTAEQEGTYIVDEEQAAIVREMFARFAAGISLRQIAAWLNKQGVKPNKGGKKWYASSLSDILKNPVYIGKATYRREMTLTDETRKTEQGFKTIKYRRPAPADETIFIAAPPLVTESVYNTCQAQFARNRERQGGDPKRRYLLSGIALCPLCGGRMGVQNNDEGRNRYYVCRTSKKTGECSPVYHKGAELEPLTLDFIEALTANPEWLHEAAAAYDAVHKSAQNAGAERARIEKELAALNKREQDTITAQIAGIAAGAAVDAYNGAFAAIAAERARILARLDDLVTQDADAGRGVTTLADKAARVLQDVQDALHAPERELTGAEKNQLLSAIIDSVTPIDGGEVEIALRNQTVHSFSKVRGPKSSAEKPYGVMRLFNRSSWERSQSSQRT